MGKINIANTILAETSNYKESTVYIKNNLPTGIANGTLEIVYTHKGKNYYIELQPRDVRVVEATMIFYTYYKQNTYSITDINSATDRRTSVMYNFEEQYSDHTHGLYFPLADESYITYEHTGE